MEGFFYALVWIENTLTSALIPTNSICISFAHLNFERRYVYSIYIT